MWNVALKKRKIVWVFILPIRKKISSGKLLQTINTEDTVMNGEFKKQKAADILKSGADVYVAGGKFCFYFICNG